MSPFPNPLATLRRMASPLSEPLARLGSLVMLTGSALAWLARPPVRFSQFFAAMEFIGVQSLFIILLTGTFSGMVFSLQTVAGLREFGAEGVVGSVVALSLTREISPVFTALMVTARAGSAIAAELGNMRITEQVDAITTMGVNPVQYLVTPRIVAGVVMVPLLCIVYTCVGMVGAWMVAVSGLNVDPGVFLANVEEYVIPRDFWIGQLKSACFGFLIISIACENGFRATGGARGVGQATTRAVVQGAVSILIANYIITDIVTPQ